MLVHKPTESLLLNVPDPFLIRELLPKSKVLDTDDYNVAVKYTTAAAKILRNIGIEVPAPILSFYEWPGKYKPFDHQQVMAEFLTMHKCAFNLSEMGTGKTAAALWAADWLMKVGSVRRTLILSPLSTVERVWASDIFDVLMHRTAAVVHGTCARRLELLDAKMDFYILNHDGVAIQEVAKAIRCRPDIDLIIVDEGSKFRNHGTTKYRALQKLLRPDMRLWWLTGTPCPNAPTDVWAQVRLVNPERVPRFFGAFKRATMADVSNSRSFPKLVARPDAYTTAYAAMQPAIRFRKADCLDLPPVITEMRQADLTKEQRSAFKAMQDEMSIEHEEARAAHTPITAVNAADKVNKLRQILCGAIKHPQTGEYAVIPHGPRTEVLLEAIEDASAKALVIVPFKGIIRALEKEVQKRYSVAVLNGDVPPKVRDKIIREFKTAPDPQVLLCHPAVMAHGLNLVEADTTIFYAPIYSNDEFQQVIERFNRAGQTRKMTIIRIAAHPLEWEIYKIVDTRSISQDNVLKLYGSILAKVHSNARRN